jgi:hypothetical protein
MVSATIVWFGGQMTPAEAAAPVQSGPYPLLELLVELLLLELLLLELLLELSLPDRVSATTTLGPSAATATSALAPRSAYTSFDIDLSFRCLLTADRQLASISKRRHFPRSATSGSRCPTSGGNET